MQGGELQRFEAVEPHMGTLFRIELYARDEAQARGAFERAFARIAELDSILSDYQPDSELNRLCRAAAGRPTPVSEDLFRVLEASQDLAARSGGAFDITLGPVIRLWRQARRQRRLPEPDALREAAERCGYRKLHLSIPARTAQLDQTGMQLDLGGIAKGYAAEAALEVIGKGGIRSALVAASGDLAFSAAPPGKRGWSIGIDSADRPEAGFSRVLLLSHAAVSTSGGSEQYLEIGGRRYSHIIDPATHLGLTRDISVTVVAPHGATADALALAVSVLGPDRAVYLIGSETGAAALVVLPGKNGFEVRELGLKRALHVVK